MDDLEDLIDICDEASRPEKNWPWIVALLLWWMW